VKMDDIAKLAGVSKSAVSLALSGKPGIGNETRDRILQIAKQNGYFPKGRVPVMDNSSKSLTFLVLANSGFVFNNYYQQPFFRELIHYIEEGCRSKGYSLIFSSIDMEHYERDIRTFAEEQRTDGVILLGTNLLRPQIAELADMLPNLVVLDNCYETLPVHFVEINNYMGAYQAGAHLYSLGHKKIGYISSNIRIHNFEERKRGFTAALQEHGLQEDLGPFFSVAPTILSSQESLKKQLEKYLASGRQLPTALFCECDYIAISAMKTLTELGYRVPGDVSIMGFDNIGESVIVSPELTTIHVEKERMARLAVDTLIDSIGSSSPFKTKIKVDTHIVERSSCYPPLQ
jgi:DNA-binding LacI/PurR family transcriptional regulator